MTSHLAYGYNKLMRAMRLLGTYEQLRSMGTYAQLRSF